MNGKVYSGHVGDSRIVLGRKNKETGMWIPKALTKDHKPDSEEERERISKAGGEVMNKSGVDRVVWFRPKNGHKGPITRSTNIDKIPFLAVARSLGDLWSYNPDNDTYVVSPEPDVAVLALTDEDKCLILASDGLWNMLLDYESVRLVQEAREMKQIQPYLLNSLLRNKSTKKTPNPSELLVQYALQKWGSSCLRADNTSAVTLILTPCNSKASSCVPGSRLPRILPQTGNPASFYISSQDPQFIKLTEEEDITSSDKTVTDDEEFALLSPSMQSLCKFTMGSIQSLSPKFSFSISSPIITSDDLDEKKAYIKEQAFASLSLKTPSKVINGFTVVSDFDDEDYIDAPVLPGKRNRSCCVSEGLMEAAAQKPLPEVSSTTEETASQEKEVKEQDQGQVVVQETTPVHPTVEERVLKPVDSFSQENAQDNVKPSSSSTVLGRHRGKKRRRSKLNLLGSVGSTPTKRLRTRSGLVYAKSVYQRVTQSIASKSRALRSRKVISSTKL